MTRVRVKQKVSYAVVVRKVEEDGSRVRDPERIPVRSRSVTAQRDRPMSDICISKVGFLAFREMELQKWNSNHRK